VIKRRGRRGFAIIRHFFGVICSVKLLFFGDKDEVLSRVKEPATPDARVLGGYLVLYGAREENHKCDSGRHDKAKPGNRGEELGRKKIFINMMVGSDTIDRQDNYGQREKKAKDDADGIKLVEFGETNDRVHVNSLFS